MQSAGNNQASWNAMQLILAAWHSIYLIIEKGSCLAGE